MQRKSNFIWIAIVLFMASSGFVNGQVVDIVSGSPQNAGTSSFGLVLSDPSGGVNFNFQSAYDIYAGEISAGSTTYYSGFTTPYSYGGGDMNLGMSQGGAPTAAPGLYDFELLRNGGGGGTWNCTSCFEISCPAPTSLSATNITSEAADLNWLGSIYATSYQIEYGTSGYEQGTGTPLATAANSIGVSGLTPGTSYDFYVRAICSPGDFSGWTMGSFTTTAPLVVVSGSPQNLGTNSFGLVLSDPSGNFNFQSAYDTYSSQISAGSTAYFSGFIGAYGYGGGNMSIAMAQGGSPAAPAGLYNVQLQRAGASGGSNAWECIGCFEIASPIANDACGGALPIPVADDTTVVSNGLVQNGPDPNSGCTNAAGADDDAWYVFVGTGVPVEIHGSIQGGSTDFVLEVWDGCPTGGGTLLDCDDDGNVSPATLMPLIQMCTEAGTSYYMRIFEWNTTAGLGTDQMGLTVKEVRPVITGNSNVSTHGMTINFSGVQDGDNQIIRYHEFGNSPNYSWKVLPGTAQAGYVNGLSAHTRYTFRIGSKCPGEGAAYGDTATFWTRSLACVTPTASDSVIGNSAVITWASTGANYYKIRYRPSGGSWSYEHTGQTFLELEGLTSGTYEWQIRAICANGGNQPYSPLDSFTVAPERLASVGSTSMFDFNLYPNPTNGLVTIEFVSEIDGNIYFNLTDLTGKIVMNQTFSSQKGANKVFFELDNLESGIYLSTLSNNEGISERVRIVLN